MNKPTTPPPPDPTHTVFEHPMSERMRSFLRMESALRSTRGLIEDSRPDRARAALTSLLELSALSERGELKRDILSELERQKILLGTLCQQADIDDRKLADALGALERERRHVESQPDRIGQKLKSNEFLASVRSRSSIPGGTCSFDLPGLHCWLTRPDEERLRDLEQWFGEFSAVSAALDLLLKHIRDAAEPEMLVAEGGIYEYLPPNEHPPVLLRILLPTNSRLYPTVSGSKHRVTIQFHHWNGVNKRDETQRRDIEFQLARCRL